MSVNKDKKNLELRKKAEELIDKGSESIKIMPADEIKDILHELNVHQIELEIQNDELRHAQLELTESRDMYTELFEFAPVGYVVLDIKNRIIEANLTMCDMVGIDRSHLLKKSFNDLISFESQDTFYLLKDELFDRKTKQSCQLEMLNKDGEKFCASLDCTVIIDSEGMVTGLKAAIDDITERKQWEERQNLHLKLLAILNQPDNLKVMIRKILLEIKKFSEIEAVGIRLRKGEDYPYFETNGFPEKFVELERFLCSRDAYGEIERDSEGNPFLECMCGNVIRGRTDPSYDFFTEEGSFWSNNTTRLLAETSEEERQARTRNRCNGEGYESVALVPLKLGDEIVGLLQFNDRRTGRFTKEFIEFFENIGNSIGIAFSIKLAEEEREKKAAELIAINKELEQYAHANKELKQFAYIASHELKEPLRTIANFIQIINEDYSSALDDEIMEYLKTIDVSVKRMGLLINFLLNFSRLGVNKKLGRVDCKELIDSVLSDLEAVIKSSQAIIEVSEMPKLNVYEIEFRQIFQNLITNAIKFRKKDASPKIQICAEKINENYRFSVSDNGIGIRPIHFDRVFGLFQRLHDSEEAFDGKGIGLSYCKKMVQMHKGEIWIESESGKGTTVYFTISGRLL